MCLTTGSMLSPWLSIPMGVFITAFGIVRVNYFSGPYLILLVDICLIFIGVTFLASKFNEIKRAPRLQLLSIAGGLSGKRIPYKTKVPGLYAGGNRRDLGFDTKLSEYKIYVEREFEHIGRATVYEK